MLGRRLGIDDVSYERGHRYLTVMVACDRGRLVRLTGVISAAMGCRFV